MSMISKNEKLIKIIGFWVKPDPDLKKSLIQ